MRILDTKRRSSPVVVLLLRPTRRDVLVVWRGRGVRDPPEKCARSHDGNEAETTFLRRKEEEKSFRAEGRSEEGKKGGPRMHSVINFSRADRMQECREREREACVMDRGLLIQTTSQ